MKRWYALSVAPSPAEAVVGLALSRLGLAHHHLTKTRRRGKKLLREAVFPGYLFVRFDRDGDSWKAIPRLPGVIRVCGHTKDNPIPLPDGELEALVERLRAEDEAAPEKEPLLTAGERVKITHGPLAALHAVVQWSRKNQLGLEISGGPFPLVVSASPSQVERV